MDGKGKVPIDRGAWSASSRQSIGHYDADAREYEGIRCRCYGCGISFVCSAEEQRNAYEVEKRHVSWLPKLCPTCTAKLADLCARDGVMQARWNREKDSASQDAAFVREWQDVIGAMSALGVDKSMAVHLKRLTPGAVTKPNGAAPDSS